MKPLYTVQELAAVLRLQPGTVRNRLSRGEDMPRSILVGRRRLFPEDGVETWLRARESQQAAAPSVAQPSVHHRTRAERPGRPSNVAVRLPPAPRCRKPRTAERHEPLPMQIALFKEKVV